MMELNSTNLAKVTALQNRLDAQLTECFSLKAQNAIAAATPDKRKEFAKARERLGFCVAELKNSQLSLILDWLKTTEPELRSAITSLEDKTDDFLDFVATIAAIARIVDVIVGLIGPIPLP